MNSTQECAGVHRSLHVGLSPSVSQRLSSFKRYCRLLYRITENEYEDREGGEEAADLTSSPDAITQHPIGGSAGRI